MLTVVEACKKTYLQKEGTNYIDKAAFGREPVLEGEIL